MFLPRLVDLSMVNFGKLMIILGVLFFFTGIIVVMFDGRIKWFGNLPLDIKYESDSTRFYAPIGSMILVSLAISILINVFIRLFK